MFRGPASEKDLDSAERELGLVLPQALVRLYRFSNGSSLCSGNVTLYPLRATEDQLSLVATTPWLRECGWPLPDEVLIFGDCGSDSLYGLWLGEKSSRYAEPVVEVGEIFDPGCMALTATNFLSFLTFQTAYFLSMANKGQIVRETLGVPESILLPVSPDDETFEALRRWADPNLPEISADPHVSQLDAPALRRMLA